MERQTDYIPNRHRVKHKLFPISLVCQVFLFVPLHLSPSALNAAGELESSSACKDLPAGLCQAAVEVAGCDGGGGVRWRWQGAVGVNTLLSHMVSWL